MGLLQFGLHPAWVKFLLIIAGTFILEDAVTILAAMAVQARELSAMLGITALYTGVILGDIGLYLLGWLAVKWQWIQNFICLPRKAYTERWFQNNIVKIVIGSRFIPGARLPFYTACGFFRAPFWRFVISATLATLIWTTGLFLLSLQIGKALLAHGMAWRIAGILGLLGGIYLVFHLIKRLQKDAPEP